MPALVTVSVQDGSPPPSTQWSVIENGFNWREPAVPAGLTRLPAAGVFVRLSPPSPRARYRHSATN